MQETVNFQRYKYIGGSDIPIIMSLSPFKTRWKLLREKAQLEEDTFQGSIYTEYGNVMESKIRDYVNESLGFDFQEGKAYKEGIRIHTDGEDILKDTILEVKTTSHIYPTIEDYKLYLVQLLFYMCERDYHNGLLAVYERPEDMSTTFDWQRLMTFPIVMSDYKDLIAEIYEEVELFKADLAKLRQNPFMTEEELIPEDTRIIARRLIAIKEAKDKAKELDEEKELLEKALGEAFTKEKRKTAEIGGYKVTWTPPKEDTVKLVEDIDWDELRAHPKIAKKVIVTKEKVTKGSKGKVTLTKQKE